MLAAMEKPSPMLALTEGQTNYALGLAPVRDFSGKAIGIVALALDRSAFTQSLAAARYRSMLLARRSLRRRLGSPRARPSRRDHRGNRAEGRYSVAIPGWDAATRSAPWREPSRCSARAPSRRRGCAPSRRGWSREPRPSARRRSRSLPTNSSAPPAASSTRSRRPRPRWSGRHEPCPRRWTGQSAGDCGRGGIDRGLHQRADRGGRDGGAGILDQRDRPPGDGGGAHADPCRRGGAAHRRLGGRARQGRADHRRGGPAHQRHRQPDQSSGAQRHHRGGARRRCRQGLHCRGIAR